MEIRLNPRMKFNLTPEQEKIEWEKKKQAKAIAKAAKAKKLGRPRIRNANYVYKVKKHTGLLIVYSKHLKVVFIKPSRDINTLVRRYRWQFKSRYYPHHHQMFSLQIQGDTKIEKQLMTYAEFKYQEVAQKWIEDGYFVLNYSKRQETEFNEEFLPILEKIHTLLCLKKVTVHQLQTLLR